jgi:hypothetical protein
MAKPKPTLRFDERGASSVASEDCGEYESGDAMIALIRDTYDSADSTSSGVADASGESLDPGICGFDPSRLGRKLLVYSDQKRMEDSH